MERRIPIFVFIAVILVSGCAQKDAENEIDIQDEVSIECEVDKDCVLVNKQLNYSSCWPGVCEEIDYSLPKYVAVNKKSFEDFKGIVSSPGDECGPQPLCPIKIINDNFTARCMDNICKKVPVNEK